MADQGRGNQNIGRRNPAENLSHEDRVRGGERSAQLQQRDEQGQFAGRSKGSMDQNRRMGGPGRMSGR